jgi:hypothetical protein
MPGASTEKGFEEAGRLDNLELAFLQLPLIDIYNDVAVSLYAGDVMDVNIGVYGFGRHFATSRIPLKSR